MTLIGDAEAREIGEWSPRPEPSGGSKKTRNPRKVMSDFVVAVIVRLDRGLARRDREHPEPFGTLGLENGFEFRPGARVQRNLDAIALHR